MLAELETNEQEWNVEVLPEPLEPPITRVLMASAVGPMSDVLADTVTAPAPYAVKVTRHPVTKLPPRLA